MRDLKKMRPLVEKTNVFDEEYKALTDEQLQAKTQEANDSFPAEGQHGKEIRGRSRQSVWPVRFRSGPRANVLWL